MCPTLLLRRRTPLDSLWLTRNYPDLGYHPECSIKYTVLYLELIRSLLDPFQVSHTIIETSDSFRLPRTHSELPWLGLSPGMLQKVHGPVPWVNPFTIRPFSSYPSLLLGRRTTGKGIGVNTHHCVSISDRMAGWPSTPVIRVVNWSPNDMGMYIYISQTEIYILSHTNPHTQSIWVQSHNYTSNLCI